MPMIHYVRGDVLAQIGIIVHGCNVQGVMGKGIAKSVKEQYPKAYEKYIAHHKEHGLTVGLVIPVRVAENKIIVNAITQEFYKKEANDDKVYVDYTAIATCFSKVQMLAKKYNMPIHFPKIGAGLAGGDWNRIARIIDDAVDDDVVKYCWLFD